ncbi:MAG: winged helix-turn-helix transcriptional regulator [Candidatus Margulisbacteria bacterium]|nr:winged helix-turn-helix transcriptional regulator [Candidatus Margulisiibacteriota bacterium]
MANVFIASFYRPSFKSEITVVEHETIGKTIDKELSLREQKILQLISKNASITQKEIAVKYNANANSLYHEFAIYYDGVMGSFSEVIKYND